MNKNLFGHQWPAFPVWLGIIALPMKIINVLSRSNILYFYCHPCPGMTLVVRSTMTTLQAPPKNHKMYYFFIIIIIIIFTTLLVVFVGVVNTLIRLLRLNCVLIIIIIIIWVGRYNGQLPLLQYTRTSYDDFWASSTGACTMC